MTDIKMAIEQMEEIVSYFRATTSTAKLEPNARNILNMLKEMQKENPTANVTLCKNCIFGYQDEASLSLGTVRCSKLNCFKLENWYCGDGKLKEDYKVTPIPDEIKVVMCKDCKHRPVKPEDYENGFDLEFPDGQCPAQCSDGWYSWYPSDNWYCCNGEHK